MCVWLGDLDCSALDDVPARCWGVSSWCGGFFCCLAFVHVRGSCFVSSREVGGFRVILRSRSSFRGCDHSPIADLCRGIFLILFFFCLLGFSIRGADSWGIRDARNGDWLRPRRNPSGSVGWLVVRRNGVLEVVRYLGN